MAHANLVLATYTQWMHVSVLVLGHRLRAPFLNILSEIRRPRNFSNFYLKRGSKIQFQVKHLVTWGGFLLYVIAKWVLLNLQLEKDYISLTGTLFLGDWLICYELKRPHFFLPFSY